MRRMTERALTNSKFGVEAEYLAVSKGRHCPYVVSLLPRLDFSATPTINMHTTIYTFQLYIHIVSNVLMPP
jgi:hypothetical protein